MKTLAPFAIALSLLTGCRNAPELTTLPDPPTGLAVSWAFDDCAPWDGAATTIYLAGTTASEPRNAPYPHAWVSLYRPVTEVTGRTFRWDEDDKDTGGAMWCEAEGQCEAAIESVVRIRQRGEKEAGLSGVVDLVFPSGVQVAGGFRAAWITNEARCG